MIARGRQTARAASGRGRLCGQRTAPFGNNRACRSPASTSRRSTTRLATRTPQIEKACTLAALLNRGKLVLVEPPRAYGDRRAGRGPAQPAVQPARRRGVSSSSEPSTTSAAASASSPGGNSWFGIAITRSPAARAARMPLWESSMPAASAGSMPIRARRLEEHVGRGLAARDLLGGHPGPEDVAPARTSPSRGRSPRCWTRRRARAASAPRSARRRPRRRAAAAAAPRSCASTCVDDAVGDLARLERNAELVVHVGRPLGRAHAEHRLASPRRATRARARRRAPCARRPRRTPSRAGGRRGRR